MLTIDANYGLDLYVSGSKCSCVLRVISTNCYFLTIAPKLGLKVNYRIYKVLLSVRGYLIIQCKSELKTYERDMLLVYGINGDLVALKELDEFLNDIFFDTHQYFIVQSIKNIRLQEEVEEDLSGILLSR